MFSVIYNGPICNKNIKNNVDIYRRKTFIHIWDPDRNSVPLP